jgi:ABC-type sugar transport system ATPase subunit
MATSSDVPLIEMEGITKRFGQIEAVDDVDLTLYEGDVLGLLGDNGAGKSTLIKTLVGLHSPTEGTIRIRGEETKITSPKDARKHGIATVYQDLALVDERTVAENMFLGRYPVKRLGGIVPIVDYKTMNERTKTILKDRLDIDIDPTASVEFLSGGERQSIAIARALVTDPDIIIMDEPTSALSADAADRVQRLISTLQDEGITIIIISHDFNEVFSVTNRVMVLNNGSLVGDVSTDSVTKDDLLHMMVDGTMPAAYQSSQSESSV